MSLKEIAKQLGLSVTTVSRALNGYDDVSEETYQRVKAEADRRGYRPNSFARRLKMGKIDAVGLILPTNIERLNDAAFMNTVGHISQSLSKKDIDLLLIADDFDPQKSMFMRIIGSRRVDALIVAHTLENDPRLQQLQRLKFPFLALGRSQLSEPYAWFDFDNYAGTQLATQHLIDQGHQRIAFFSEGNDQSFVIQRLNGYLDTLKKNQLSFCSQYLCQGVTTRRDGYLATQRLLALDTPPTAIITDCNMQGDGAAMALAQADKLQGPSAISLIVFDGLLRIALLPHRFGDCTSDTRTCWTANCTDDFSANRWAACF
ncbi:Raffinose operon repressor [Moellerella wisconsensis]|nr:Raffinose operon repressor [Moellerella wisconsensis]